MANMDLLSYERDSRWMPHLSWTYPEWAPNSPLGGDRHRTTQSSQRELAWQKIADKLGPLLVGGGGELGAGGSATSFGHSDYVSLDISGSSNSSSSGGSREQDLQLERAYEKAPLLSHAPRRPTRSPLASSNITKQQQQHQIAQHSQGESEGDSQLHSEGEVEAEQYIRNQPAAYNLNQQQAQDLVSIPPVALISATPPPPTLTPQPKQQQHQLHNQHHHHHHHHQQCRHNKHQQNRRRRSQQENHILDSAHLHYLEAAKSRNCSSICSTALFTCLFVCACFCAWFVYMTVPCYFPKIFVFS